MLILTKLLDRQLAMSILNCNFVICINILFKSRGGVTVLVELGAININLSQVLSSVTKLNIEVCMLMLLTLMSLTS